MIHNLQSFNHYRLLILWEVELFVPISAVNYSAFDPVPVPAVNDDFDYDYQDEQLLGQVMYIMYSSTYIFVPAL